MRTTGILLVCMAMLVASCFAGCSKGSVAKCSGTQSSFSPCSIGLPNPTNCICICPTRTITATVVIVDVKITTKMIGYYLSLDVDVGSAFTVDLKTVLTCASMGVNYETFKPARFGGIKGEVVFVEVDISAYASLGVDLDLNVSLGNFALPSSMSSHYSLDTSVLIQGTIQNKDGRLNLIGNVIGGVLGSATSLSTGAVTIMDATVKANILKIALQLDSDIGCGFSVDVLAVMTCTSLNINFQKVKPAKFTGFRGEISYVEVDISSFSSVSASLDLEVSMSNLVLGKGMTTDIDISVKLDISTKVHTTIQLVNGALTPVGGLVPTVIPPTSLASAQPSVSILSAQISKYNVLWVTMKLDADVGTGFSLEVRALLASVSGYKAEVQKGARFVGFAGEVAVVNMDVSSITATATGDLNVDIMLTNLVMDTLVANPKVEEWGFESSAVSILPTYFGVLMIALAALLIVM